MPEELLMHIFSYCDWRALAAMQATSTKMLRVAHDEERRRMRRTGIHAAIRARDTATMHVYVKHAVPCAERTAVRCLLRFCHGGVPAALLERQLLCFIHGGDVGAAELVLTLPGAVALATNDTTAWLEWCVATAVWSMARVPHAVQEWVARLAWPLRRQDAVFCDHLFFTWPGCRPRMAQLLAMPTADGTPLLAMLRSHSVSFAASIVNSAQFHHFLAG